MSRLSEVRVLRSVCAVRRAQAQAAEADLGRAGNLVAEASERRDAGQEEVAALQAGWRRCIDSPVISPELVAVWSAGVLDGERKLQALVRALAEAEADKTRATEVWRGALAKVDAADAVSRRAVRRLSHAREEAALNAAADRAAQHAASRQRGRP